VSSGLFVELQRARKGVEDLRGGMMVAALLET
jgi:hypothetical protein